MAPPSTSSSNATAKIVKLDASQSLARPAGRKVKSRPSDAERKSSGGDKQKKKRSKDAMEEDGDEDDEDEDGEVVSGIMRSDVAV